MSVYTWNNRIEMLSQNTSEDTVHTDGANIIIYMMRCTCDYYVTNKTAFTPSCQFTIHSSLLNYVALDACYTTVQIIHINKYTLTIMHRIQMCKLMRSDSAFLPPLISCLFLFSVMRLTLLLFYITNLKCRLTSEYLNR